MNFSKNFNSQIAVVYDVIKIFKTFINFINLRTKIGKLCIVSLKYSFVHNFSCGKKSERQSLCRKSSNTVIRDFFPVNVRFCLFETFHLPFIFPCQRSLMLPAAIRNYVYFYYQLLRIGSKTKCGKASWETPSTQKHHFYQRLLANHKYAMNFHDKTMRNMAADVKRTRPN